MPPNCEICAYKCKPSSVAVNILTCTFFWAQDNLEATMMLDRMAGKDHELYWYLNARWNNATQGLFQNIGVEICKGLVGKHETTMGQPQHVSAKQ